jgi:hypothetical protein
MANTEKHFQSFVEVWGGAQLDLGNGPVRIVGGVQPHTSYPVPVRREGKVQIAYMVCSYIFSSKGSWIWPPDKVEWFDPVSGDYTAKAAVSPADFGQSDPPGEQMKGSLSIPSNMGDTVDSLRKRLFQLYDILFPVWATGSTTMNHVQLQINAREFLKIFDQISEPPLRPYYAALGRDWFGWLRELAK